MHFGQLSMSRMVMMQIHTQFGVILCMNSMNTLVYHFFKTATQKILQVAQHLLFFFNLLAYGLF